MILEVIESNKTRACKIDDKTVHLLSIAEDRRFFNHYGFDAVAIARAIFRYLRYGEVSGASTIEQQLVRTITRENKKNLTRKLKEIILATSLGVSFSKTVIAKTYLLLGYYGWGMTDYFKAQNRILRENIFNVGDIPYVIVSMLKYPLPQNPTGKNLEKILRRVDYIKTHCAIQDKFIFLQQGGNKMELSKWANKVFGHYPKEAFENPNLWDISNDDITRFIRLYIFDNLPHFVIKRPLVFDHVRARIAEGLEIDWRDVNLTGSSKLGFSLVAEKWLNDCSDKSDLDFFVISEKIFTGLKEDLLQWNNDDSVNTEQFKQTKINKMKKGFIDTWDIGNDKKYPVARKCYAIMWCALQDLQFFWGNGVLEQKSKASIRCYKDRQSAINQMKINIRSAIEEVKRNNDK